MRKLFTPAITAKKLYSLFILSALLLMPVSIQATVLLNEHFNQATETLATNTDAYGNAIASTGWTNINGSGNIYMNSTNLSYSGYKSTADETGGAAEYKTSFGKKAATPITSTQSGSLYAAAIINFTGCSALSSPARDYLWSFVNATSSVATAGNHFGRLCAQKSSSTFQLGVAKSTESAAHISYTDELTYGTYLIVFEYEFVSGDQNDVVRLYVNPTRGDKPATATIECKQSYSPSGSDVGSGTKADPQQLAAFMLYSTSSTRISCLIDELKVVTDWDDLWEEGEDPDPDPEPVVPVPEPAASDKTISSATISWDAVEDADSYILQWKINGGSYSSDIEIDKDERSYSMSGLESETKYYVRVKTIIGEDESDWAEINFTTLAEDATIEYKDITFDKYSATNAMPTSGTVYLAKNIVDYTDVTLTGNLTLNLHGKQIYMFGTHINVPNGKTLTIYDDAGDGVITGGFAGDFMDKGLISVDNGGTLIIGEGAVVNTSDNANDYNAAIDIASGGTLKLSGAPTISGVETDIYLNSNEITIESGKPLTNTTPYKVFRLSGVFTSGWANMGGEKPSDYFVSSASTRGVCLGPSGEGQMVSAFSLSENSNNSDIATYSGTLSNISMTRSLTSSQYNTFCLPFALDDDQLEEAFGAEYDLREFESSSLDGEVLSLTFSDPLDALEAGKPYLLQPSIDVVNPSFEGVTISATSPVDQESDDYIGNELFWPAAGESNTIKGFRAYFVLQGAAASGAAKRARIVKKEDAATGMDQITNDKLPMTNKILRNGQLFILRDNKTYNVLGMEYK